MEVQIHARNDSILTQSQLKHICVQNIPWLLKHFDTVLIPFILHDTYISKRLIYWFVSKYCKTHPIIFETTCITNVFQEYCNHLRLNNRRLFDTFCRRPYIVDLELHVTFPQWQAIHQSQLPITSQQLLHMFLGEQSWVRVSLGQLNFFRWAHSIGVLKYVVRHANTLVEAMKADSHHQRQDKRQKIHHTPPNKLPPTGKVRRNFSESRPEPLDRCHPLPTGTECRPLSAHMNLESAPSACPLTTDHRQLEVEPRR